MFMKKTGKERMIELHKPNKEPLWLRGTSIEVIEEADTLRHIHLTGGKSFTVEETREEIRRLLHAEWERVQQQGPHYVGVPLSVKNL